MHRRAGLLPGLVVMLACVQLAHAHAPGLSSTSMRITPDEVELTLTLAPQDVESLLPLDSDRDAEVSPQEWQAAKQPLAAMLTATMRLEWDGRRIVANSLATVSYDSRNNVRAILHYPSSAGRTLGFDPGFLGRLPDGHRHAVTVKRDAQEVLQNHILTRLVPSVTVTADTRFTLGPATHTFTSFLHLGIEHIITGYDHLLFLLGLLLVGQRVRDYVSVVTCFTLAHSLTLGLATLGYVVVVPALIEPLIAATIVYVGAENLLCGNAVRKRYPLVLLFGLIHGFGFAGALSEAGIGANDNGLAMPLLAFNLGVELGQISVVAFALPALQALHRYDRSHGTRWTAFGSGVVVLAGCYWFWERTPGFNAMTELVGNW